MDESLDQRIARTLTDKLVESLQAPIIEATPRRVSGTVALANKATFLHQLRRERMAEGIPQVRLPYVSFEDERLAGTAARHLGPLVEEYYRRHPAFRGRDTVTWCFDEIQVVPGWERFVRRLLDTEKVEIFLSGSSAALLSREVATSMRGRGWEVIIHPFSFAEVLRHAAVSVPKDLDSVTAA